MSSNEKLIEIISEILEIEPEEMTEDGSFADDYDADSMRAVEVLASLEREYNITIPEEELEHMGSLREVKVVLGKYGCSV